MVKLAQTDPAVAISMDVLDTNKWLLNCANGTVDLKTGELRAADRGDMITKRPALGSIRTRCARSGRLSSCGR